MRHLLTTYQKAISSPKVSLEELTVSTAETVSSHARNCQFPRQKLSVPLKGTLLILLLFVAGGSTMWGMSRAVSFANQNRISNNGAGVFTSASNAGNEYALALADLSTIPGIESAGSVQIEFDSNIPSGSRWLIGVGDKDVRGANANGSNKSNYQTDGLIMRFGTSDGTSYRVNGGTSNTGAFGVTVHATITFDRIAGTYSYTLTNGGTTLFSETGVATSVANLTLIEAYTWANNTSVTLNNVTVQYADLYFTKAEDVVYIEDLVYEGLTNGTGSASNATYSTTGYFRLDSNKLYPITTTGSDAVDVAEGDPITVTITAGTASAIAKLRIKTRAEIEVDNFKVGDIFTVGNMVGKVTNVNSVTVNGVTITLGNPSHTPVVRSIGGGYGITVIDNNGFTHGNYADSQIWGTVYKLQNTTSYNKTIYVSGYFNSTTAAATLYDSSFISTGQTLANPGNGALAEGSFTLAANSTYYLYSPGYDFCLSLFSGPRFTNSYAVTSIGSTYTQAVSYMTSPTYSIVDKKGDIASASVTVSNTGVVSGLTAGGAVRIQATNGVETVSYVLTVAYEATPYPGHLWDFYTDGTTTTDGLKTVPDPKAVPNTTTGLQGETWRAEYKNSNEGKERGPQWYMQTVVAGDNAFYVPETAGLVFHTANRNFYLRNDASEFKHIGIRGVYDTPSFTIPRLKAGDIVEINWKHDADDSGATFSATNLKDLRDKEIPDDDTFLITKSQDKSHRGWYSFVVRQDGDVTFTLHDNGNTDILTIRIYNGGYRPTMRAMREYVSNNVARSTLLLDNVEKDIQYHYCNQMYSTGTGPAFCVLKGYVPGTDDISCVTGSNAATMGKNEFFSDENAYPVSQEESDRLYDLRKNLVDFKMYNSQWYRANQPTYNYGHIAATSGYGKVTMRMNNYTNDMKYLIGYTPDYTLTIGSAPHQEYPYTWDFTHVSAQQATNEDDNVVSTIEAEGSKTLFNGMTPTNWDKKADATYLLNTDNSGEYGSQYVPGAVLVSQDRALSAYRQGTPSTTYALDELDGLGFNGELALYTQGTATSGWNRTAVEKTVSLLSFAISDYVTVTMTTIPGTEEVEVSWKVSDGVANNTDLEAGNGKIQFGNIEKIVETVQSSSGYAYQCDGGESKYLKLILPRALESGDVIKVRALNLYDRTAGVGIHIGSEESSATIMSQFLTARNVEETLTYTVSGALVGQSVIYLRKETNTVHITAIEVTSGVSVPTDYRKLYAVSETTITVPDLNKDGKQDWIYVSASAAPTSVDNATIVESGDDGPDGNTSPELEDEYAQVYKYKVTNEGNAYLTFAPATKIYKIGVTDILKEIHPVGSVGWATESRGHSIDHALTGYFTMNDVNAYTVGFDSYDLSTATVALTPINEDGYVPALTGMVLKLAQTTNLNKANKQETLYRVPLFYPSYTLGASSTPVDFPANNLMYPNLEETEHTSETVTISGTEYTKFLLTNVHWTYHSDHSLNTDETGVASEEDAAGFYRMHIWKTLSASENVAKNTVAANLAYLCVPTDQLPLAVWSQQGGAGSRPYSLAILNATDGSTTGIRVPLTSSPLMEENGDTFWYTLGGIRLYGRPTKPGLYIYRGRKVVIK